MTKNNTQSVGAFLKQTRKKQKLSLQDIADKINIRTGQLEAIENDNIDQLPGMIYAIGFVKSYAVQLNLDGNEISAMFKKEHGTPEPMQAELNIQPSIEHIQTPNDAILIGAAVGICITIILWFSFFSSNDKSEIIVQNKIPEIPAHLKVEPPKITAKATTIIENTVATDTTKQILNDLKTAEIPVTKTIVSSIDNSTNIIKQPRTPKKPRQSFIRLNKTQTGQSFGISTGKSRISLRATASSWLKIKNNKGKTIFRKVLRPGQVYHVPNDDGLTLTTANAGGLDVWVDGKAMPAFGKNGDIISGIHLNPDKILRKNAK